MTKLRECPFCGGDDSDMGSGYLSQRYCTKCGARGPERIDNASANESWNRRTSAPMTSVIEWTRYDGTPETLPLWNTELIIAGVDSSCVGCYVNRGDSRYWVSNEGDTQEVEEGDIWAYLPNPPDA